MPLTKIKNTSLDDADLVKLAGNDGSDLTGVLKPSDVGTGPDKIVQLDTDGKLPGIDGSALVNIGIVKAKVSSGSSIPNPGDPLIINSSGEVELVTATGVEETIPIGIANNSDIVQDTNSDQYSIAYDPNDSSKFVIVWSSGASLEGYAMIGNVSGIGDEATLSYNISTKVRINKAGSNSYSDGIKNLSISFSPHNPGEFIVAFTNANTTGESISGVGFCVNGKVDYANESILIGTEVQFQPHDVSGGNVPEYIMPGSINISFDPINAGQFLILFVDSVGDHNPGQLNSLVVLRGFSDINTITQTQLLPTITFTNYQGDSTDKTNIIGRVPANTTANQASAGRQGLSWDPNQSGRFIVGYIDHISGSASPGYPTVVIGTVTPNDGVTFDQGSWGYTVSSKMHLNTMNGRMVDVSFDPYNKGRFVAVFDSPNFGVGTGSARAGYVDYEVTGTGNTDIYLNAQITSPVTMEHWDFTDIHALDLTTQGSLKVEFIPNNSGTFITHYKSGDSTTSPGRSRVNVGKIDYPNTTINNNGTNNFTLKFDDHKVIGEDYSGNMPELSVDPTGSGEFIVGNTRLNHSTAYHNIHFYVNQISTIATNLTSTNYIGMSKEYNTQEDGETTILIDGSVSSGHAGLSTGELHYIQPDGSLKTTPSTHVNVPAGTALSATELLIKTSKSPEDTGSGAVTYNVTEVTEVASTGAPFSFYS